MPILDKGDTKQIEEYNRFVKNNEYSNFMQDIIWTKVKNNWGSEIVVLKENNEIYAAMQILIHRLPRIKYSIMYVPRGPVCDFKDVTIVDKLIEEANIVAKKYNAFMLKMEPKELCNEEIKKTYRKRGYILCGKNSKLRNAIQPIYNMIVDIKGKNAKEVIDSFSPKCRYNIRYAYKNKIEVYYSNKEEDLKIFYELYKVTTKRDKFDCRPYEYFKDLLQYYQKNQIRIYIAKHEGEYLAASIAINYAKEVYYMYGASASKKRNLMPTYALQWGMIKWAIDTNCDSYNLGGLLSLNKDNGLYQFKIGFCRANGVKEYIGEVDKVYNYLIYGLYKCILPMIRIKNELINGTNTR